MANKRFCTVCGREKEQRLVGFGDIKVFIECECERRLREEKEKRDGEFALRAAVELRNKSSHLSPRGRKASFDSAIWDKHNERALNGGKYLLDKLLGKIEDDKKDGLVLLGTRGSGKTYVACALINDFNRGYPLSEDIKKRLISERERGFSMRDFTPVVSPCRFITETDLFAVYYDDFNYRKVDSPANEFKCAKKLLVIDDVGTLEYEKSRVQAMYLNIIDYRYSEGLPTVITTNLPRNDLCDYLGDRVYDRLLSCCYFVELTAPESRRGG